MALVPRADISKQRHLIPTSLTHSGGIITAVVNGVTYTHTLSGLSANTLYFLYMRINGGSVFLTSSTTVPSTYRTSFADAILVGAFYSNGPAAWGSFVNIEGAPNSLPVDFTPTGTWSTNTTYSGKWYRQEGNVYADVMISLTGAPNAAILQLNPITNLATDTSRLVQMRVGQASLIDAGIREWLAMCFWNGNSSILQVVAQNAGGTGTGNVYTDNPFTFGSGDGARLTFSYPVVGWSNTPLKDL